LGSPGGVSVRVSGTPGQQSCPVVTILAPAPQRTGVGPQDPGSRWPAAFGLLAAGIAAAVGLAVLGAVSLLLWATGSDSGGSASGPFRTASWFWLLGQRSAAHLPAGRLQLAPLGLTAILAVVAVRAAGWAARTARAHEAAAALAVVGGFAGGSGVLAMIAAHETTPHGLSVAAFPALRAALVFALVTGMVGVAPCTWEWAQFAAQWRGRARPVLRASAVASLILFGGGALVVAVCVAVHNEAVAEVFDRTGGGHSGFLGLALISVLFLPNAACWAVGFAAGPGVALAADAHLDFHGMDAGVLPGLPLTAALPQPGPLGWLAWLPMLVPLAAGLATGWTIAPDLHRPVRGTLAPTAAAAGLTGLLVGTVCWLSAGDGGGRLTQFGPSGWQVGGSVLAELLVIALPTAAIRLAVTRHRTPAATVPAARRTVENGPAAPVVVADDADRFPPMDLEDLEDTQEIPVIRLFEDATEAAAGQAAEQPGAVEAGADETPRQAGEQPPTTPGPTPVSFAVFAEPEDPGTVASADVDLADTQPIPVVRTD
jgi:hypothetical protein